MSGKPHRVKVLLAGQEAHIRIFPARCRHSWSVVALHGFTGSGEDFLPLRKIMGEDRHQWICPDFMGHGSSASPPNVDPYLLPWTLELVDQARQLALRPEKTLLLGYSMGGRIALHYLRWGKSLPTALIGASPGLSEKTEREARRRSDQGLIDPNESNMEAFCALWEAQPLIRAQTRLPEPLNTDVALRRRGNNSLGLHNSLLSCGTGSLPSLWEFLDRMPPVLCVAGEKDQKFRDIAHGMNRLNPLFEVSLVPGSGHAPHLEHPESLGPLLEHFMQRQGSG